MFLDFVWSQLSSLTPITGAVHAEVPAEVVQPLGWNLDVAKPRFQLRTTMRIHETEAVGRRRFWMGLRLWRLLKGWAISWIAMTCYEADWAFAYIVMLPPLRQSTWWRDNPEDQVWVYLEAFFRSMWQSRWVPSDHWELCVINDVNVWVGHPLSLELMYV